MRKKTRDRLFLFAGANAKISQHVERREIGLVVLNDLPVFFNGAVDVSPAKETLGGL